MEGPLGRRPPSDWKHVDKYPLTARTAPAKPTPVVIGVNWYVEFDKPAKDANGHHWIARNGKLTKIRGGHCVCLKPKGHADPDAWWNFYDQGTEGACVGFGISRLASQLNRKLYDGFWLYHEAQKVDEWPGECVDYETECLSTRGWLRGDELEPGDRILTFDLDANATRWAEVDRVHRHDIGAYREWCQRGFSIAVTDNHRWVVTNRDLPGRFDLVTTRELRSQHALPLTAPCLDAPHDPLISDDLTELVAWVMCEGHYRPATRRGNGVVISQKVHRDRVARLMRRVGGPRGTERDGLGVWELSGTLAATLRDVAPDRAPTPEWLMRLTQRQLRLFIETCVAADGNVATATDNRRERATFSQLPGRRLDAFLTACALAGQATSRARVAASGVETWTLRSGMGLVQARKLAPGPFVAGPVWCPQTAIGTFVARRRGSVFITGNSYDGTSVRAGLDILRKRGHCEINGGITKPEAIGEGIKANRWARSVDDVLNTLGYTGLDYVDVLNSWGRRYPHLTRMPATVLERLWREDGEVGIVTDR